MYSPFLYQSRCMNLIRKAVADGHRYILVQGETGMGKSVIISEIIRGAFEKGKSVRCIIDRKKIFRQLEKYIKDLNIPFGLIKGGEKHEDWHQVQLGMVQSIHRRISTPYMTQGDVIIRDEGHAASAPTDLTVTEHLMHPKSIYIALTATPARDNGYGLKKAGFTILIQSRDYGGTSHELINMNPPRLVPIRYYAPVGPDLVGVPITGGDYNLRVLESRMLGSKLIDDYIGWWFKLSEKRKTFVFCTSIKHSVAVRDAFIKVGITCEHMDGNTPDEEQDAIYNRFESGETLIITSCEINTTGVDIPQIACIMDLRPTKSLKKYFQILGRGRRVFPGKKDLIFICLSKNFAEHGAIEEFQGWTLDDKTRNINTANAARKARNSKPIECPVCSNIYTGQLRCPQCHNIPTKAQYGKDEIEYIDGILGEIVLATGKAKVHVPTMAEKKDWYQQAKNYGWSRGKDDKWLAGMFKACFGSFPPWSFQNLPIKETSAEVSSYLDKKRQDFARRKAYGQKKQKGAAP
ncbi:MAG: DEAD/DEAH box helicase family protein [Nitrososphaeria archaeon]